MSDVIKTSATKNTLVTVVLLQAVAIAWLGYQYYDKVWLPAHPKTN